MIGTILAVKLSASYLKAGLPALVMTKIPKLDLSGL